MPIDPRIALGFQPVQTPDFLGMENQVANIRQSRAAEQNNLALLASRERERTERNAMAQLMSRPDFDINNPEFRRQGYALAPGMASELFQSAAALQSSLATTRAQEVAREANQFNLDTTKMNESVRRILSFGKAEDAYDSLLSSKDVPPDIKEALRQSLLNKSEGFTNTTGYRDWQADQIMALMLTPKERVTQARENVDLGGSTLQTTYDAAGRTINERTLRNIMTPAQIAAADLARDQFNAGLSAAKQVPGNPGMFYNDLGQVWVSTVGPDPSKPEPTLVQLQRHSDGVFRADNIDDLLKQRLPQDIVTSARGARNALETMGYGGQKMQFIMDALRNAPKGGLDAYLTQIKTTFGESSLQSQAVAELTNMQANIVIDRLFGKLGVGISNADVELVRNSSGIMVNPNSTPDDRVAAFLNMIDYLVQKARYPNIMNTSPMAASPSNISPDARALFNPAPAAPAAPAAPGGMPTRQNPMFPFPR